MDVSSGDNLDTKIFIKKKKIFPPLDDQYINNLNTDYIGEFSITLPDDAKQITEIIKNRINRTNITITEATAGLGGNVISFASVFDEVIAIEINPKRYEFLINNINAYGYKNVTFINDNFLNVVFNIEQDVLYIDPPWGGRGYKRRTNLKLRISNIQLENICNMVMQKNSAKMIVLKLPLNYDIDFLKKRVRYSVDVIVVNKMFIVIIK